jgi:hypothetical protein
MAVEEGLIVSVKGDTSDLQKGAALAVDSLGRIGNAAVGASQKGVQSFENLKKSQEKLVSSSNSATIALTNLGRVAQDAPFGFIGISNNLNPLLESFQRLQKEAGSTSAALKIMGSSLLGGGGLGLALSAVTAILNFSQIGFSAWTRGAKTVGDASEEASGKLDKIKDSLEKVAAGFAADNITKLESYGLALSNLKLPLEERNKVLDQYNKLVDKQNELSKDDLDNINKINGAIQSQIQLFEQRALVKAAEDQIKNYYKTIFENQFQLQKLVADSKKGTANDVVGGLTDEQKSSLPQKPTVSSFVSTLSAEQKAALPVLKGYNAQLGNTIDGLKQLGEDAKDPLVGLSGGELNKAKDALGLSANGFINNIKEAKKQVNDLYAFIQGLIGKGGVSVLDNFDSTKKGDSGEGEQFNFFDRYFNANPKTASDKAKQAFEMYQTALEYAVKNQNNFKGLDAIISAHDQTSSLTAAKKWWEDVQRGIIELKPPKLEEAVYITPKLETNDAQVVSYVHALQQQLTSTQGVNPFDFSKVDKDLLVWKYSQMFKDIGEKMPTNISFKNDLGQDIKSSVADMNDLVILAKSLGIAFEKAKNPLEALNKTLQQTVQSGISGAIASVGKGIGDALAGDGGFSDAFKGIFAGLGDMIEQLGEAMIQFGIAKEIALSSIKALQPGAAIAAGVGLVVLGEIVKTKMTTPHKFSQGGLVPGSGNSDTVPALLTPGEFVLTRDMVNRLSGGNIANVQSLINGLAFKSSSFDVRGISSGMKSGGGMVSGEMNIHVHGRMSGNDIVLSGARTSRRQGRAF